MVFVPTPTDLIVLGAQGLTAGVIEEELALHADKHGVRDGSGRFRSKWYGVTRAFLTFTVIAWSVSILPTVLQEVFTSLFVQTFGLCLILATMLVHSMADEWFFGANEVSGWLLSLVRVPLAAVGGEDVEFPKLDVLDIEMFAVCIFGFGLVMYPYVVGTVGILT